MLPTSPGGCMLAVVGTLALATAFVLSVFLIPVSGPVVAPPTPGNVIGGDQQPVSLDLANAEAVWYAANVDSYRIQVQIGGAWRLNTYTITVQNGRIVDAAVQCDPGMTGLVTCPDDAQAAAGEFTVASLFARLHSLIDSGNGAWLTASYDPALGYPVSMGFNHPEILDEEWFIRVLSFEVLPG